MNLGEKILKIRKDNKMSQEQLAEILNVTRQTVSNWENGNNYPDIETLINISDRFKVSLDILLKGDKEMIKDINKKVKNNKVLKRVIIVLSIMIIFLVSGYAVYKEYFYHPKIIYMTNKDDGAITNICSLDGKRIKIMALVQKVCEEKDTKESLKIPSLCTESPYTFLEIQNHCVSDFTNKPSGYKIIDNKTKEEQKDLMENSNINIEDYDNTYDLLEDMEDYIISIGGTCDEK